MQTKTEPLKQQSGYVNPLGTQPIHKLLVKYAIPSTISFVVNAIYNILDQIYIGHTIGVVGMAATNVAFPLSTIAMAMSVLISSGAASSFNLNLGAEKKKDAAKFAGNGMVLALIAGISIMILSLLFLRPMLVFFGATSTVMVLARPYTIITALGIPFSIVGVIAADLIRADGSPRYAMASMLAGAILNVVFDPIFLFVFKWGISGLALSNVLGQALTATMCMYYILRSFKSVKFKKHDAQLSFPFVKKIVSLGGAASINQLSLMAVQISLNNVLKSYGANSVYGSDIPIAVVGAISKINSIYMAFTLGIAQAMQPIAGFNYGAKKYKRVRKAFRLSLVAVSVMALVALALFQLFPRQIMFIFGQGSALYYEFATKYMRIFMLVTFAPALQPLVSYYCTAIGKAGKGILIGLTRRIIFFVPLCFLLPMFFGMDGVLYAGPISDATAVIIAIVIALSEFRLLAKVEKEESILVNRSISEPK